MPQPKYRVALVVDHLKVAPWVRDLAEWAKSDRTIELVAILHTPGRGSERAASLMARLLLAPLVAIERRLLRLRLRRYTIHDRAQVLQVSPALSDEELKRIRKLNLHAIVQCGSGPLGGRFRGASRDGIIALRYGDCTGGLPGFREVLEGRPVTEFAIERLSGGASELLFRGSITTQLFYSENRSALEARATPYLFRTIERLARGELQAQAVAPADPCKRAGTGDVLIYAARTLARVARKAWRHATGREWNWGVACSFAPWQAADLKAGHILPKPRGTFVADPFAVEVAGKRYIFVEEFPYATRKGVISVFEVDEGGATRLGVALEEPYHLSFPFVFRKDGRFYMVPEGQGGSELVLYECQDFPLKWTRKKVLMSKVCADTVIFEHGGRWWMLTSIKGEGTAENSAELYAFHADDPLGEWRPHRMNPVVMDASKGRNGGLLRDDEGGIYRVAQRAGFRTYGDGFAIYRIEELTPDSYREALVREVRPDFFPKLAGAHHMHSEGGMTVYDFSRDERP